MFIREVTCEAQVERYLDSITFYCHDVDMENDSHREYSIGELADRAGVSTRTIRYYVSEGLLPPPAGAGPNSRYTDAHLEQLAVIGRLKEQYLPLKEIRRRLIGQGMPDAGIYREADADRSPASYQLEDRDERAPQLSPRVAYRQINEPFDQTMSYSDSLSEAPPVALANESATWRRVPITPDAELLITADQYERHQDKIDWLVQWAARVLD